MSWSMDPYMFGAARFFWPWAGSEEAQPRPAPRRRFGRHRAQANPVPEAVETDAGQWPGLWLLAPVDEDEVIAFGRELEAAEDVVGALLTEH
ncbi:hypothetical protein [Kribbella sp. NPDC048928]|uniref:hypothetical protein n=1 Tax=Kribbella sp. NPDC048928 TaxID=3364111 RepID=UPI003713B621